MSSVEETYEAAQAAFDTAAAGSRKRSCKLCDVEVVSDEPESLSVRAATHFDA